MSAVKAPPTPVVLVADRPRRRLALRPLYEPVLFAVVMSVAFAGVDSSRQFVLLTAMAYALLTASLGVLLGWSGVYSFGHALFFGIGAYTAGLIREHELSPVVVLALGALAALAVAFVIGLLGSRIVAVEFAMMTLIVGQVAYLLTFKIDVLAGDNGIFGIPAGTLGGVDLTDGDNLWWYTTAVVTVGLVVLRRIHLSPFGASLAAVRDDPVKAAAIGLPVKALRLAAFTLAGLTAGVAGALFAQQQGIVTPSTLTFAFSGQLIIMLLLGGMRSFWGAPIGAVLFMLLNNEVFGQTTHVSLVLGLILLFIVVVMPGGVVGALRWALQRIKAVRS